MKKAIFTLGLLGFIFSNGLYGQQKVNNHDSTLQQFHSLFIEAEFDVLQVYSLGMGSISAENIYQFKGIEIDTSLNYLLKDIMPEAIRGNLFAICRFNISADIEALILREFNGVVHHIHYLVYNNFKHKFVTDIEIAYYHSDDASFGGMESWIIDLNKDGKKDIIIRSYSGSGVLQIDNESVSIAIWKENELVQLGISDTIIEKQLAKDFPYFTKPQLGYDTERNLSAFLKEKISIEIPEYVETSWYIIAGNSRNLPDAKNEIERAEKIIGSNYKYGLSIGNLEIHKKNELYYTVIAVFETKAEAEIALKEIKNKFSNTAYLINYNKWCKKRHYHPEGYSECTN